MSTSTFTSTAAAAVRMVSSTADPMPRVPWIDPNAVVDELCTVVISVYIYIYIYIYLVGGLEHVLFFYINIRNNDPN